MDMPTAPRKTAALDQTQLLLVCAVWQQLPAGYERCACYSQAARWELKSGRRQECCERSGKRSLFRCVAVAVSSRCVAVAVSSRCVKSLCQVAVSSRCVKSLCQVALSSRSVMSTHQLPLPSNLSGQWAALIPERVRTCAARSMVMSVSLETPSSFAPTIPSK
jgi:hypothetical protein